MLDHPLYNEKVLLDKVAAGDERAFKQLFDLYKERFYSVVLKMTGSDEVAKDIVQDTFMNIWDKREILADIDNPSAYFFTAVYRRVYHHYRKVAQEKKLLEEAFPISASVNTTEEMVLAHESKDLISEAVEKLPPQQKLVFRLSRQEGLSREDVARQLHISPNTVKNHLAEALKFIRTFLRNSEATFLIIFWFFKK
ncbi:MAG: RNA polymerase sigma-70 factor [Ginsengibacter sp.]